MIFRKPSQISHRNATPLERIQARINQHSVLRLCIMDASEDEGALVIFCAEVEMINIVKLSLQNHWPGEVEVFCPSSLMTGANEAKDSGEQHYQSMEKSLRYLN